MSGHDARKCVSESERERGEKEFLSAGLDSAHVIPSRCSSLEEDFLI